jgi:DNA-binding MarR family transcriptional regulator
MKHANEQRAHVTQPIEELRYLILAAQREGNRPFADTLRPLRLTPSQAEVLRVLQDHKPLSLIALGDLLVCETGNPSRLVQGLVEVGLIERIPASTDKRMVTLTLTNLGREMAADVGAIESQFYEANAGLVKDAPCRRFLSYCGDLSRASLPGWPWHAEWAGEQRARRALSKEHISWVSCHLLWRDTPCSSPVKEFIPVFSHCQIIRIGT